MTNKEADQKLLKLGKDRQWLSDATGYSINSMYNTFAGAERELNARMRNAFEKAFREEEHRQTNRKTTDSLWSHVTFTGEELFTIERAKKAGGYAETEDLFYDAIIHYCDDLLTQETQNTLMVAEETHPPAPPAPETPPSPPTLYPKKTRRKQ